MRAAWTRNSRSWKRRVSLEQPRRPLHKSLSITGFLSGVTSRDIAFKTWSPFFFAFSTGHFSPSFDEAHSNIYRNIATTCSIVLFNRFSIFVLLLRKNFLRENLWFLDTCLLLRNFSNRILRKNILSRIWWDFLNRWILHWKIRDIV